MKLQALQDCLIVRPDIEKHELIALIRDKKTGTGVVVSAGPNAQETKIGDRIVFGDFVGQDLCWNGEGLLVMRELHVMGVYDDE